MRVLAFDTTTSACSVAVWLDGDTIGVFHKPMLHGQAEALLPAIEKTMADCNTCYDDLDRIAVTIGPGSFTGVRVGLAAARGMGVATGLPVFGVLTTQVIATEAIGLSKASIAVAIDARRAEVYLHCFDQTGSALDDPQCLLPEMAAEVLGDTAYTLVGDGAARIKPYTSLAVDLGNPDVASAEVLARIAAALPLPEARPEPVYVRPPDAVIPKHGGRLRP